MKAILLLFIYCASFVSHSYQQIEVVYYKSQNPPFQFDNDEDKTGFITSVINSLPNLGLTFKPKTLPFKQMIKEMGINKEHWISYGSKLWVGAQSTSLSEIAIWNVNHVFLTLKSNEFEDIRSLFDQTLVLIDGFDYPGLDSYINKGIIEKVIRVKTPELAILSVLKGDADVYPDMRVRVQYYLNKMQINKNEIVLHDKANMIPDYDIRLCFSEHFPSSIKAEIEIELRKMKRLNKFESIMNNLIESTK